MNLEFSDAGTFFRGHVQGGNGLEEYCGVG